MALVQNFNVNPYYDDYNEDKKFLRMLFRPGYAIQARELTQLQTILQKQVSRFGKHVFRNGSVVTGGEVSISSTILYHKLETTDTLGNDIDVNNFLNKNIGNAHALISQGSLGKVVAVTEATDTDPPTIFVEYKTALTLMDGETIFTIGDNQFQAKLISSDSTGRASIAYINDGVYFIDDFFVKVTAQTLILEKYTNLATYRIGVTYDESIVDETTDSSLLDPALNASNYQAPGSTRYKVELTLEKRSLTSIDDTKFVELVRIESGQVTLRNSYPLYADLERTLARRTYDESGNYTVRPFTIYLTDHVPANTQNASNSSLFTAKLSEGKAYVRGFEIETLSPTNLEIERSREKAGVSNYDIDANYGNYIVTSNVSGPIDVSSMQIVDMHCVDIGNVSTANATTYNSTKIGTIRLREIEYVSAANTQRANTYSYNMYTYDSRFTGITANANTTGSATTIVLAGQGAASNVANAYLGATVRISAGYGADNVSHTIVNYNPSTKTATISGTFATIPLSNSIYTIDFNNKDILSFATTNSTNAIVFSANVSSSSIDSLTGDTYFSDTDFKSLVFRVPQSFISFGMSDQDFRGRVVFKNQTVTAGVLSISTGSANNVFVGSGALSDAQKLEHFYVIANNAATAPEFTNNQAIPLVGSGRTITVSTSTATLDFNTANSFTADILATIDFNSTSAKTKTLVSANTTNVAVTGGTTISGTTVYLTHGQVAISTPNKTPGQPDSLYISDVYKLEDLFEENYASLFVTIDGESVRSSFKVIDSKDPSTAVTVADLSDTSKDITARYTLDDGQKDGYYDHGAIVLKPGASPPTGQLLVLVNYFTHAGSGYFTVDSYNNSSLGATEDIRYAKIPNFTSPTTGDVFKLRDCVDFRPIRTNASSTTPNFTLSGISIPKPGEALESDYDYYLARIDRLVLKENKKFEVIKGISGLNPQTPPEPDNSMSLYTIRVNPYTFFPSDTKVRFIENKRYTMRDIGRLEKRIENLEYYTSLNTLEKSAQDLVVLDDAGLTRFKNGILVDSFRGHQVGDVKNLDYVCSMDFEVGELRPSFNSNSISFVANTTLTTATVGAGTIYTAPYSVVKAIEQNVATGGVVVNPFTLSNYVGTLDLFPAGDFWIDTQTRPDVLVNLEGENDAWAQIGKALEDGRQAGWGNQWGDWNTFVSGTSQTTVTDRENRTVGYYDYQDTVRKTTTTTYYSQERFGTRTTLVPERISKKIGNRQVDLSVIPYVRAQWIIASAKGLRPNQYHYLFAEQGDVNVTKYIEYPTVLWLYDVTGDFNDKYGVYETITSTSGGTARVVNQSNRSWSLEQPYLHVVDCRGDFNTGDTITGSVSGSTAKIDVLFWNNGNVVSSTANTITLASSAEYDNVYVDIVAAYANISFANTRTKFLEDPKELTEFYKIRITSGTGIGQERTITKYDGNTKIANVSVDWTVRPDSTSRWTVGKPQSDDHGKMSGRWYLANYGQTAYDSGFRSRTGARLIRLANDSNNNPDNINSFAEEYWQAQGVLNVVEDVSVSVRVPTAQSQRIYEKNDNYRNTSVVNREILGTTLVADRTPPPEPPPPPSGGCSNPPNTTNSYGTYRQGMVLRYANGYVQPDNKIFLSTSGSDIAFTSYLNTVNGWYNTYIGRNGDEGGMRYWVGQLYLPRSASVVEAEFVGAAQQELRNGRVTNTYTYCEYQAIIAPPPPPPAPPPPPPSGGGGSGCKIICTKLHELGYLPDEIFEADQLFGEWLRETDPYAYYGYIKWASVVVDWMEKDGPQCMFWIRDKEKRNQKQKEMAIRWARKIATPWAQHMAYKMGVLENDSRAGKAIMKTGLFISRMIGKLTKTDRPTKSVAIGYAMWASFALFWLLANLKDKKTQGN